MTTPFFSIIVPTYNSERTILNTLNSITNQTFNEFEIIILDNCSDDNTLLQLSDFKSNHSNLLISIFSEKDQGVYHAMNKGILLSQGKWLYFLGSDDELLDKNVLENIYSFASKPLAPNIIYGNVVSELFDGEYDGEFTNQKITQKNISHQAIFFDKSVFNLIGNYSLKYRINADWEHNLKWFFNNLISKQYVALTIAKFGPNGISSSKKDIQFKFDKEEIIFKVAFNETKQQQRKIYCKSIIHTNLKNKKILKALSFLLILLLLPVMSKSELFIKLIRKL